MKSRVRAAAPKKIIGYNIDDAKINGLTDSAKAVGAELLLIGREDAAQKVGYLAGFNGFERDNSSDFEKPDKECIIFSGFDNKSLDELLLKFDDNQFDTDLKCIVTPTNQRLPVYELIGHLWEEHLQMS